jgi:hypothetical protein
MDDLFAFEGGSQFFAFPLPFYENDAEENHSASGINDDAEQDDLL